MAKDKKFEAEYKAERLRRTKVRKAKRREERIKKIKYKTCPCCGRSNNDCIWDDW